MAEYLIQDTTLTAIGDAIRAKTETSDLIPVSNLATKISEIETGVTVQRTTGTFRTNSSGSATVDCGFKPDLVVFYKNQYYTEDNVNYYAIGAFPFAEYNSSRLLNAVIWTTDSGYEMYDMFPEQTDTGFEVNVYAYDDAWNSSVASSVSFTYVAVKYS